MRFLPILLVAAVVGIQASPLGDARNDCKANYKTYRYESTRTCIQLRYRMDAGDGLGDVCGWADSAPKCLTSCRMGKRQRWCPLDAKPDLEACCNTQCCDLIPP